MTIGSDSIFFRTLNLRLLLYWLAAGLIATVLAITGYFAFCFLNHAPGEEIYLFRTTNYAPGQNMAVWLQLRDGAKNRPLPHQPVVLNLMNSQGRLLRNWTASTSAAGELTAQFPVPPDATTCRLSATYGEATTTLDLSAAPSAFLNIVTDRQRYQPGQIIHIRALQLNKLDLKPLAGARTNIELFDSRNNQIFQQTVVHSDFGIGSLDIPLASQLNTGTFRLEARSGNANSSTEIEVMEYALPRFRTLCTFNRNNYRPGDEIEGSLTTAYLWHQPLAQAQVAISVSTKAYDYEESPFLSPRRKRFSSTNMRKTNNEPHRQIIARIDGRTTPDGRFDFRFKFPEKVDELIQENGRFPCTLEIKITAPDGSSDTQTRELNVSPQLLKILVWPEGGKLLPVHANQLWIFTCRNDGTPVSCSIKGNGQTLHTDANGCAGMLLPPAGAPATILFRAEDQEGNMAECALNTAGDHSPEALVCRADKPVYRQGETARINVIGNVSSATVHYLLTNGDTLLQSGTVELHDRKTELQLPLNSAMAGTLQFHVYRFLPEGKIGHNVCLLQVNPKPDLVLHTALDHPVYRPGQTATLTVHTTNAAGQPQPAAVSVAAVDEATLTGHRALSFPDRAAFLIQEQLLRQSLPHQAALLVPDQKLTPGQTREAAWLLSNPIRRQYLSMTASTKYCDREQTLTQCRTNTIKNLLQIATILVFIFTWLAALIFWRDFWRTAPPQLRITTESDWSAIHSAMKYINGNAMAIIIGAVIVGLVLFLNSCTSSLSGFVGSSGGINFVT